MNKIYRRNMWGMHYRLSRSVKARDVGKLFGCNFLKMPDNVFSLKSTDNRLYFNYRKNYVDIQIHLWKLDHGKFKTFKKGEITDDYRYSCRRDCGC